MRIRWYGQSAFRLEGEKTVVIDPFGDFGERAAARGIVFDYPPIEPQSADLLLITHEHADHNAAEIATGEPETIRSTAGTFGDIVAVASEHDHEAGTRRGPNTIFRFSLDGLRVCHLGDFGQAALRPEQQRAIGEIDVLFIPVGGGPTIGAADAAELVRSLAPRLIVPMHYRTPAADFLEPPDDFLNALGVRTEACNSNEVVAEELLGAATTPVVALLTPPTRALSSNQPAPRSGATS
jgi:L-ascorbate metabolism protein UlaG (beta-lactamase superfamily)